jgi:hypothetical protein
MGATLIEFMDHWGSLSFVTHYRKIIRHIRAIKYLLLGHFLTNTDPSLCPSPPPSLLPSFLSFFSLLTGSHYVVQADPELLILLHQPSKCWD